MTDFLRGHPEIGVVVFCKSCGCAYQLNDCVMYLWEDNEPFIDLLCPRCKTPLDNIRLKGVRKNSEPGA